MDSIENLIQYENENTRLDFKKKIYVKGNFHELLSDIIAFANSHAEGDKYIICGVKTYPNKKRDLFGVEKSNILDSSSYEQLIQANIEPEIHFEFSLYEFESKVFAVFKIINPTNRPYILKKQYHNLNQGFCQIRKGTHKMSLTRSDFDKIYEQKYNSNQFNDDIDIWISNLKGNKLYEIEIKSIGPLPSERAKLEIEKSIENKKRESGQSIIAQFDLKASFAHYLPYKDRDIITLKENLENVYEDYLNDDLHELFDKYAEKINFTLCNNGQKYLRDSTIQIFIPKSESIQIFDEIYGKPVKSNLYQFEVNTSSALENLNYPQYHMDENYYVFEESMGHIKHNLKQQVFKSPIRILFLNDNEGKPIEITVKIHGENLVHSIEKKLSLKLIKNTN